MRIAAVDDELHALKRFERMVCHNQEVELCGLFETGAQLLEYLAEHKLDAVFVDIEMPDVNGLELTQQILDLDDGIEIIFVTAFNQYAVEAFELQALDYILKPLKEDRLEKTLNRLLKANKPRSKANELFIQCLGDFEVFVNGKAMVWKYSKAKEILAFLVHKGGIPVNWEKITDAVWPEYDSEKSQANFHANNYLLRKSLASAGISKLIEGGRGSYRIVREGLSCDVYTLESLIVSQIIKRKEDISLIEEALKRGYMEGNGYAWAQPRAAEIEVRCKSLLEKR